MAESNNIYDPLKELSQPIKKQGQQIDYVEKKLYARVAQSISYSL